MQPKDFTAGENLFRYLGSFWSQIFPQPDLLRGMTDAVAANIIQAYSDMAAAINSVGMSTVSPLDEEKIVPVLIYRSKLSQSRHPLRYGDPAVFGPQSGLAARVEAGSVLTFGGQLRDATPVFVSMPDNMLHAGNVIVNRLFNPSVVLVRGVDYVLENGDLVFRANPFDNPLISASQVATATGEADDLIVLWMSESLFDRHAAHAAGGYLFYREEPAGVEPAAYAMAVKALMSASAGGPSIAMIDSLIAATSGLPVIVESREVVESIFDFQGQTTVVTDLGIYRIPTGLALRGWVVPGAEARAGTPLSTATEVMDSFSKPLWWADFPLISIGSKWVPGLRGSIGFPNQVGGVDISQTVLTPDGTVPIAQFSVVGSRASVEDFWKRIRTASIESEDYLANRLWIGAGLVDVDGDPDFSQSLSVNPLQLLVEEICPGSILAIKISASSQSNPLLSALSRLEDLLPAYSAVVVFLDYEATDEMSFEFPDGFSSQAEVELTGLDTTLAIEEDSDLAATVSAWGLVDADGQLQTPVAEALSSSNSPDIIIDILDLPASALEDVRIVNSPICNSLAQ